MKEIYLLGGSWISSEGAGNLSDKDSRPVFTKKPAITPDVRAFVENPSSRYSRFDTFTRQGYLCAAMALKNAGISDTSGIGLTTGIIISSWFGCYATDLAFQESTMENDGEFSSPQLFSYTLPGIITGEIAVTYSLKGPTFSLGETGPEPGTSVLEAARAMLEEGICETLLIGWDDAPPESFADDPAYIHGTCFAVMTTDREIAGKSPVTLSAETESLYSLFQKAVPRG